MDKIKSLQDLDSAQREAARKQQASSNRIQIIVSMGTSGVATGSRKTLKAVQDFVAQRDLTNIIILQTGDTGLDSCEPVLQVVGLDGKKVSYGQVDPEAATKIMREHILGGRVVQEYVLQV